MKKLIYSILSAFAFIAYSCSDSYDDSYLSGRVDNLEQRVKSLEEICKQININISSLQTLVNAMQDNDFITGVNPLYDGDTHIGYTIDFAKSESITIYHGKDGTDGNHGTNGTDGKDGADGYTPKIGISQDSDGHYYWTLDGEWLLDNTGNKVSAEGLAGKDGSDGKDGVDGKDGQNGSDGKDGVTPQFKIEDGDWFISLDNGLSWQYLGRATGADGKDGQDGAKGDTGSNGTDGKDGEAMFSDIDTSDPDFVIFTLLNGTQIKLPTWYAFEELKKTCEQMNTNISSLQTIIEAVQDNDYLVSVTPIMEGDKQTGHTLNFAKAGAINIYHGKDGQNGANGNDGKDGEKGDKGDNGANGKDGQDGHTPVIGVKEEGGVLYWTVDGEFLLDSNQNKIPVTGKDGNDGKDGSNGQDGAKGDKGDDGKDAVIPQFKIEGGYWYVSTDNGDSWQNLGKATGDAGKDGSNGEKGESGADGKDGADGDSFFESVTEDENYIHIKLKDSGETIDIPKNRPMDITFSETEDIRVEGGKTYKITYTVTGVEGKATVKAYAQDGYRAQVEAGDKGLTGTIYITTPSNPLPSEVLVFVSDGSRTIMRSINFVADIIVVSNKTYYVSNEGATIDVEVTANVDYTVEIQQEALDWVSQIPVSRAVLRTDRLQFKVAKNEDGSQRTATIEIKYKDTTHATFLVVQHAGVTDVVEVPSAGGLKDLVGDNVEAITRLELTGHLNIYDYEFIKSLPNLEYLDLSKLEDTTMPETCLQNSKISTVILPEKLIAIPEYAFDGAEITSITIPETVLSIDRFAFRNCKKISGDLVIPDYVTSIGNYAFYITTFDGKLTLGNDLKSIGNYAFAYMEKAKGDIKIPDNVKTIGEYAFRHSTGFDGSIIIGKNCEKIGNNAFEGCTGLKGSIIINDIITEIPDYCFHNNNNMVGPLIIGNSVEIIGTEAFRECKSLTGNLIIPDRTTKIGNYAFFDCVGFNGVLILGEKLTSIGSYAFGSDGERGPIIPIKKIMSRALEAPNLGLYSFGYPYYGSWSDTVDLYILKGATGYTEGNSWYFKNIYRVDTIEEGYDSLK